MNINVEVGLYENNKKCFLTINKLKNLIIVGNNSNNTSIFLNYLLNKTLPFIENNLINIYLFSKNIIFQEYKNKPNFLNTNFKDNESLEETISSLYFEAISRLKILEESNIFDISSYNQLNINNKLPLIYLICDDLSNFVLKNNRHKEILEFLMRTSLKTNIYFCFSSLSTNIFSYDVLANTQSFICFKLNNNDDYKLLFPKIKQINSLSLNQCVYLNKLENKNKLIYINLNESIFNK